MGLGLPYCVLSVIQTYHSMLMSVSFHDLVSPKFQQAIGIEHCLVPGVRESKAQYTTPYIDHSLVLTMLWIYKVPTSIALQHMYIIAAKLVSEKAQLMPSLQGPFKANWMTAPFNDEDHKAQLEDEAH